MHFLSYLTDTMAHILGLHRANCFYLKLIQTHTHLINTMALKINENQTQLQLNKKRFQV